MQNNNDSKKSVFDYNNIRTDAGCLEFGGYIQHGYGIACIGYSRFKAHRRAWEEVNGPIPEGLTIDHVCRNTKCIEVTHLRLLTRAENTACSTRAEEARAKLHCPAGHPYEGDNLYIDKRGARHCYTCTKARTKEWQKSEKARKAAIRAENTKCKAQLHEMTPENIKVDKRGVKMCIACSRATKLKWYNKKMGRTAPEITDTPMDVEPRNDHDTHRNLEVPPTRPLPCCG